MRIECARTIHLELSPQEAFDRLAGRRGLAVLMPELESARVAKSGGVRLSAQVGSRRRSWKAGEIAREPGRRWALASSTDGVGFRLEALFREHPRGCVVSVGTLFEPPARWLRERKPRGPVRRGLGALVLWLAVAAGLLGLPWVDSPVLAMLGYAVAGALFVVALAHDAGRRRVRRPTRGAWRDLRLPALPPADASRGGRSPSRPLAKQL